VDRKSTMEEMRNAYEILVDKHEGKRQLPGPRCRWEESITMARRQRQLTGGRQKLRNKELNNLCSSCNVVTMTEPRTTSGPHK
jgi:hypothetical protein